MTEMSKREYRTEEELELRKKYLRKYGQHFLKRYYEGGLRDSWVVEPDFVKWATGSYITGDEFTDWAFETRIEEELKRKFIEELLNEKEKK